MMNLVADQAGRAGLGQRRVARRIDRHLLIGRDRAVKIRTFSAVGARVGIEREAERRRRVRPLPAQVRGGTHHRDPTHEAAGEPIARDQERHAGLAGARRRLQQPIRRAAQMVRLAGVALPRPHHRVRYYLH